MSNTLSSQEGNDDQEVMSFSKFKRTYTDQGASDYLRYLTTQQEKNPNDLTIGMRIISCIIQSYRDGKYGTIVRALDSAINHSIDRKYNKLEPHSETYGGKADIYIQEFMMDAFGGYSWRGMFLLPMRLWLSTKSMLRVISWYNKCSFKFGEYALDLASYMKIDSKKGLTNIVEDTTGPLARYLMPLPTEVSFRISILADIIDLEVIDVESHKRALPKKVLHEIVTSAAKEEAWILLRLFPHCINEETFFAIMNNTNDVRDISLVYIRDFCPYFGSTDKNKGLVIKLIDWLINYPDHDRAPLVGEALARAVSSARDVIMDKDIVVSCLNFAINNSLPDLFDRIYKYEYTCARDHIKSLDVDTIRRCLDMAKLDSVGFIISSVSTDILEQVSTHEKTKQYLDYVTKGSNKYIIELLSKVGNHGAKDLNLDTIKTCIELGIKVRQSKQYCTPLDKETAEKYYNILNGTESAFTDTSDSDVPFFDEA